MIPKLYYYQQAGVDQIRSSYKKGHQRPILCIPTGGGKTITFAYIALSAISKGNTVWIVVDRLELQQQAEATLEAFGLSNKVPVFMVRTLCNRKYPPPDLIIVDECHVGDFRKLLLEVYPDTKVLGVTATPMSSSPKRPLNEVFDDIICPVQISTLIDEGFLSQPVYIFPDVVVSKQDLVMKGSDYSEASQNIAFSSGKLVDGLDLVYNSHAHEKTIVFVASVEQVIDVAQRLNAIAVHSKMTKYERQAAFKLFANTPNGWLINCGIATRGFDAPAIRNVVLFRKTASLPLFLQMIGRGSRVCDGKPDFRIFDFGDNVSEHFRWEMDRDWVSIFLAKKKKRKPQPAPKKHCKKCDSIIAASATICQYCGHEHLVNSEEEDTLVALSLSEGIKYGKIPDRLRKQFDQMTVDELIERAQYGSYKLGRPYKKSWVVAQLMGRDDDGAGLREYAQKMGYKKGWLHMKLAAMSEG